MRAALVMPFLPSGATAGQKFLLEIIKGLSARHELFILCRIEPDEAAKLKELEKYCKVALYYEFETPEKRGVCGIASIAASYRRFAVEARKTLDAMDVDVVQVSFTELGFFVNRGRIGNKPMVFDTHDVSSVVAMRQLKAAKGLFEAAKRGIAFVFLKLGEAYALRRFDVITAKSSRDEGVLKELIPGTPVFTVRQPIDAAASIPLRREREPAMLVFVGAMKRELNVRYVTYFYREIFPLIRERVPDAVFYVVGGGAPEELARLASLDKGLKVTGFVDDVQALLRRATVFVSPILIGGGLIVKNVEAMASGLPVVTTSLGNEGIGAADGREILVADDPREFAEKTIRLMEDESLYDTVAAKGAEFVRKNFSHESVMAAIAEAWGEAIRRRGGVK